jgi:Ca-activated chloride channel family protein
MKPGRLLILILILVGGAFAQAGRVKPTPTPKPKNEHPATYVPTQIFDPNAPPTPVEDVVKVESALVPIPVSVFDERGRPIGNLKLADFDLLIAGKPAVVSDLARSETPIRLALLFDNSSSVLIAREFEKNAAVRFLEQVIRPDRDLAALFSISTTARLEQGLTRDTGSLVRAIELFPPPEGATALLDGIEMAATYLGETEGRRVIVIVSDGDDTKTDTTFDNAVKTALTSNCQVFVVKTTDFENFKRTGVRGGNANIRALDAERRMLELARQTGGAVYSPVDDRELTDAFRQISAELASQYVLSYYPDAEAEKRGEFRTISLSVKGRPTAEIRTRKGYYVPKQ